MREMMMGESETYVRERARERNDDVCERDDGERERDDYVCEKDDDERERDDYVRERAREIDDDV